MSRSRWRYCREGTPADPGSYDYTRAARDALHFAALFDRFIQNLRRYTGYDVQYFAAIEPQRRLAPHVHPAIRGTNTRTELRQVLAAGAGAVAAQHLRGGPAVEFHQVPFAAAAVQPGMAGVMPEPVRPRIHPGLRAAAADHLVARDFGYFVTV